MSDNILNGIDNSKKQSFEDFKNLADSTNPKYKAEYKDTVFKEVQENTNRYYIFHNGYQYEIEEDENGRQEVVFVAKELEMKPIIEKINLAVENSNGKSILKIETIAYGPIDKYQYEYSVNSTNKGIDGSKNTTELNLLEADKSGTFTIIVTAINKIGLLKKETSEKSQTIDISKIIFDAGNGYFNDKNKPYKEYISFIEKERTTLDKTGVNTPEYDNKNSADHNDFAYWYIGTETNLIELDKKVASANEDEITLNAKWDSREHVFGDWIILEEPKCVEKGQKKRICTECGYEDIVDIEALGHQFLEDKDENYVIDKPATCAEVGYKSLHCQREGCSERINITEIPKLTTHTYGEFTVTKEPTCTEKGSKQRVCSVCNKVDVVEIDALNHDYSAGTIIDTPATCIAEGSQSKHCSRCGNRIDVEIIDALGHDFGDWVITNATCAQDGSKIRTCKRQGCGVTQSIKIDKTNNHTWGEWVITSTPTCSSTGTKTRTCSVCSKKETESIPTTDHLFGSSMECLKDSNGKRSSAGHGYICQYCGYVKDLQPHDHSGDYGQWTYGIDYNYVDIATSIDPLTSHYIRCSVCGYTAAQDHTVVNYKYNSVETSSTSTHKKIYVCKCGCEFKHVQENHNYEETVIKEATCTENGEKKTYCKNCGIPGAVTVIPKAHKYTWVTTLVATCGRTGLKEYKCSVCGDVSKNETINATGNHNYTWSTTAATCAKAGSKVGHCDVCGNISTITIPATGNHSYSWVTTLTATCSRTGLKEYKCSTCGDVSKNETISATGDHSWSSWTTTTSPTCTSKGKKTARCNACGTTKTEDIPANGHSNSWITTLSATCSRTGLREYKCSTCGSVSKSETISATGNHSWSSWSTTSATCTSSGSKSRYCYTCGTTDSETIPKLGHSKEYRGYGRWVCTRCGKTFSS